MSSFKDSAGRVWQIDLTVDVLRKIKKTLGVDLLRDAKILTQIDTDVLAVIDMIFVAVMEQAEKLNVTDEDFGRSLGGESVERAVEAFAEALIDSFPAARKAAMRATWKRLRELQARESERMVSLVQSPKMDQAFEREMRRIERELEDGPQATKQTPGTRSNTGPELLASTPSP